MRLAGLQVVSVVVVVVLLLLLLLGGGGGIYQQNSELRQDRDFLYKIPNEANIKCQLWYFIQWFKILPLGGVRPKFAKLGHFWKKVYVIKLLENIKCQHFYVMQVRIIGSILVS
jgi:hypothetical protein